MFTQFRIRYPQGSIISELVTIDHGKYVVRTLVQADGITLATGLAAADNLEQAEDMARNRALAMLDLNGTSPTPGESMVSAPDSSTTPKISALPQEKELAHPATQKPEVSSDGIAKNLPQDTLDESMDSSSSPEKLELTIPEQDSSGDGLTPLPLEIPTTQTSSEVSASQTQPKQEKLTTIAEPDKSKQSVTESPETEKLTEEATSVPKQTKKKQLTPKTTPVDPTPVVTPESDQAASEVSAVKVESSIPTTGPIDFSDIIAKSNLELKRLAWTNEQGRQYLLQTYGKRSRQLLSDEELLEFLQYLESQPTPE